MKADEIYAFPTGDSTRLESGMFLRDYFAAKAMQALIGKLEHKDSSNMTKQVQEMIICSWGIADLMLATRDAKK